MVINWSEFNYYEKFYIYIQLIIDYWWAQTSEYYAAGLFNCFETNAVYNWS